MSLSSAHRAILTELSLLSARVWNAMPCEPSLPSCSPGMVRTVLHCTCHSMCRRSPPLAAFLARCWRTGAGAGSVGCRGVHERKSMCLITATPRAPHDEDLGVGQHHAVGKRARVCHVANPPHRRRLVGLADGDDMRVAGGCHIVQGACGINSCSCFPVAAAGTSPAKQG